MKVKTSALLRYFSLYTGVLDKRGTLEYLTFLALLIIMDGVILYVRP